MLSSWRSLPRNTERYMMMGGENYEAEIERTLSGLGFTRDDFERPTKEFSGGWRMRIELAKILLQKPDVLLLDEPTNHLDIESIQWLEQFLAQSAKAVVLVSHDRAFINNVTNRTLEITCGRVEDYKVKYDEYVVLACRAPRAAAACLREPAEGNSRHQGLSSSASAISLPRRYRCRAASSSWRKSCLSRWMRWITSRCTSSSLLVSEAAIIRLSAMRCARIMASIPSSTTSPLPSSEVRRWRS